MTNGMSGGLLNLLTALSLLLVVAFTLQVPVIWSPLVIYQLASGPHVVVGVIGDRVFGEARLGSKFEFYLLRPAPWGIAVNLVAVAVLALLVRETRHRPKKLLSSNEPASADAAARS